MAEDKDEIVQTTVRLPMSLKKAMADIVHESKFSGNKLTMDGVFQEGVRLWLAARQGGHSAEGSLSADTVEALQAIEWAVTTQDMKSTEFRPLQAQIEGAIRAYKKAAREGNRRKSS